MLELTTILKLPYTTLTLKCTLFEDNKGAEELAKVPKYRPRTKHIAIKYHHFREWVQNGILQIQRVETNDQQADILTKPLPLDKHTLFRENIMGWCCIVAITLDDETQFQNMRYIISGW